MDKLARRNKDVGGKKLLRHLCFSALAFIDFICAIIEGLFLNESRDLVRGFLGEDLLCILCQLDDINLLE